MFGCLPICSFQGLGSFFCHPPLKHFVIRHSHGSHLQVLSADARTFASDVYSFGVVAWEVISRQAPWPREALPQDIFIRVVFKGERPVIPADAPADLVGIVQTCWAGAPEIRPSASSVLDRLGSHLATAGE